MDFIYLDETPEQRVAIERMGNNMPPLEIFQKVVDSIPQEIPDGTDKKQWKYGSCRVDGFIGGRGAWSFGEGYPSSEGVNLNDINYLAIYRQVAKKEGKTAQGFCCTVPLDFCGPITLGQGIDVTKRIPFDWKREDVEMMARESFLALQRIIKEYMES